MQNRVQKKKKISLTTMIFIALLAGALVRCDHQLSDSIELRGG